MFLFSVNLSSYSIETKQETETERKRDILCNRIKKKFYFIHSGDHDHDDDVIILYVCFKYVICSSSDQYNY